MASGDRAFSGGGMTMPESGSEWSDWRKSSASVSGNCVEVRRRKDLVQIRDSKDPDGPVLTFGRDDWLAFLTGARLGEFDLPVRT
jgi:hypothetical protein